jgi:hypothetical protein
MPVGQSSSRWSLWVDATHHARTVCRTPFAALGTMPAMHSHAADPCGGCRPRAAAYPEATK